MEKLKKINLKDIILSTTNITLKQIESSVNTSSGIFSNTPSINGFVKYIIP